MSDLILPEGMKVPETKPVEAPGEFETDARKAQRIPKPVGYKILCAVPEMEEKFEGTSIVKAQATISADSQTSHALYVIDMGPDAYKDPEKFPSGPWCQKGDFVVCRAYAGTRINIFGREFRLISDDQVEGVVEDPRGIRRAG